MSGAFATNSGFARARQLNVGRSLVPTLTRASQTVNVERNDADRYDPWTQLDMRFGRVIALPDSLRIEPFIDAYNMLNANTILTVNVIGTSLGTMSSTMNQRLVRAGAKVTW